MSARLALMLLWSMLLLLHVPVLGGVAGSIADAAHDGRVEPDRLGALALLLASQMLFGALLVRAARDRRTSSRGSWGSYLTIVLVLFVAHRSEVTNVGSTVFPPIATATSIYLVHRGFRPALRSARDAWRRFVVRVRIGFARDVDRLNALAFAARIERRPHRARCLRAFDARGPPPALA